MTRKAKKNQIHLLKRPFRTENPKDAEEIVMNFRWRRGLTMTQLQHCLGYKDVASYTYNEDGVPVAARFEGTEVDIPSSRAIRPYHKIQRYEARGRGLTRETEVPANYMLDLAETFYDELYDLMRVDYAPVKPVKPVKNNPEEFQLTSSFSLSLDDPLEEIPFIQTHKTKKREQDEQKVLNTVCFRFKEIKNAKYRRRILALFLFLVYTAE